MTKPNKADIDPSNTPTTIMIYGLDEGGKPHAGRYEGDEVEPARKAAGLMSLKIIDVATAALRDLALLLPAGKVYATGKAFLPYVRQGLYDMVAAAGELASLAVTAEADGSSAPSQSSEGPAAISSDATKATDQPLVAEPVQTFANEWDKLKVGSAVIVQENLEDGWWEAVITGIDGDKYTLRWRDYPRLPQIIRTRKEIALAYPTA